MSKGNLKTAGSHGNNWEWQFDMLDQLVRLNTNISGGIVVTATLTNPLESTVTTTPVRSSEAQGAQTSAGLDAAVATWIATNPTRRVVRQVAVVAGDGIPVIYISHTA